jgi:hypothetical protein
MATDRALLTKLSVFAAAIETTTGTAATLSATEAKFNAMDMSYTAEIPPNERQGQGSMSPLQPVPGARSARLQVKTEVSGNGASGDPPWLSTLIASCGFTNSAGTWKPINGPITTLSLGGFYDGRKYLMTGAMGGFTLDGQAGNPAVISYDFMGVHGVPTDVALLTPTYPTVIPPRFAASTLTIGGSAYKIGKVQIAVENNLKMREDVTHVSGHHACAITGRRILVRVSPESSLFATKDWYAAHLAGTTAALSLVFGSVANNIITIAAPKMVLLNPPQMEDDDGIMRDALEFVCVRSAAAGDDELTLAAS